MSSLILTVLNRDYQTGVLESPLRTVSARGNVPTLNLQSCKPVRAKRRLGQIMSSIESGGLKIKKFRRGPRLSLVQAFGKVRV